jgi:hypothetical protein
MQLPNRLASAERRGAAHARHARLRLPNVKACSPHSRRSNTRPSRPGTAATACAAAASTRRRVPRVSAGMAGSLWGGPCGATRGPGSRPHAPPGAGPGAGRRKRGRRGRERGEAALAAGWGAGRRGVWGVAAPRARAAGRGCWQGRGRGRVARCCAAPGLLRALAAGGVAQRVPPRRGSDLHSLVGVVTPAAPAAGGLGACPRAARLPRVRLRAARAGPRPLGRARWMAAAARRRTLTYQQDPKMAVSFTVVGL